MIYYIFIYYHLLHFFYYYLLPFITVFITSLLQFTIWEYLSQFIPFFTIYKWYFHLLPFIPFIPFITGATCRCWRDRTLRVILKMTQDDSKSLRQGLVAACSPKMICRHQPWVYAVQLWRSITNRVTAKTFVSHSKAHQTVQARWGSS